VFAKIRFAVAKENRAEVTRLLDGASELTRPASSYYAHFSWDAARWGNQTNTPRHCSSRKRSARGFLIYFDKIREEHIA
jgi:hypothetical protein